jgi:hypothetical protein
MKNKYLLIALFCCSILFTACPYNSDVTIDMPNAVKIDNRLIGKWQQRNSDDVTYVVRQKDDNTYSILEQHKKTESSSASEDKTYNGFLSDVDGIKFLNLFEPDQDSKSYYFYKIEFSDEVEGFTLFPVSDYITEKFTVSADLKKFIQQYKGLSFFYGSKDEYIKVGK